MSPVLFPLFSGPWERSPRLEVVVSLAAGRCGWPLAVFVGVGVVVVCVFFPGESV